MPFWNVKDTTITNEKTFVNNTYKDANGNNKLATNGFVPLDPNSTDPIVKTMYISIANNGDILYRRGAGAATSQYTSIQDVANGQISGYNAATTEKLKASVQSYLSNGAKTAGVGPATATDPPAPAATADPNNGGASGENFTYDANTNPFGKESKRINNYDKGNLLVYPLNRQGIGGDYIQFEIKSYKKSGLAPAGTQGSGRFSVALTGMEDRKSETLATICLPIQSGIVDSMSVDWGSGELSPITAAFASAAYNTISAAGSGSASNYWGAIKGSIEDVGKSFESASPELRAVIINYFTERAVGVNGLLSRTVGGALNNNLELLFNGPMLRSFTFNFKLTPREAKEAELIKNIIRYFKKSMVPGLSDSKLFLLAPNVFKIRYIYTGQGDRAENHPYLNRIKVAALRDFSVNYSPDGNYMTYAPVDRTDAGGGSMTQYDLSMTFGEIDPIYEPDYEKGDGKTGMGW
jgi:hypothetical protein